MSAFLQKKLALIVGIILIICFTLLFSVRCGLLLRRGGCSRTNFYDNIGQIDMEGRLSYGPIDVVYTWVNGSDPKWQATKEFYRRGQQRRRLLWNADDDQQWISQEYADIDDYYLDQRYAEDYFGEDEEEEDNYQEEDIDDEDSDQHAIEDNNTYLFKNETIIPTPIPTIMPTSIPTADQSASANRYRDSEELRYSLRSLEAYAPWVRHIYLVTDNQIPWWLNMDEKKITVVPHNAIFQDTSKLPVFSSPAIESQLHNVPGVSRQFIYFNDDVMLGAPTFPEDFVSLSGAQRIYLAWEAPKCNPGCNDNWIGDGSCDEACNVSSCDFDFPDCLPTDHPDRISYQEKENNHKKKSSSSSKYNKQARKAPVQSRAAQSAAAKIKQTNLQRFKKILIIKNVLLHVQGHGLEIPVVIRNVMLHLVFGMLVTVDPFKLMLQQIQQYLIFLSVSMVLLLILRDCLILILLMPTFKKKVLTQKLLSMISYFSDKLKSLLFILMLPKQNKFLHHGKGLNK